MIGLHPPISDKKHLEAVGYLMHFSIASYGILLMNYFGYGSGFLRDALRAQPNKKIALEHLNMKPEHMLVWEYYGSPALFRPSYFICWDERTKSIVLSIRGTLNLHELLVDILPEYSPFRDGLAHGGFLRTAVYLLDTIPKLQALIKQYNSKRLYIVGHSAGGGVAALFRMMLYDYTLSDDPEFTIKTVCFAMTATASLNLCKQYKDKITSYINETDWIPSLSYGAAMDFTSLVRYSNDLNQSKGSEAEKMQKLDEFHRELVKKNENPKLYPPGKIYYIYKTSRVRKNCKEEPHYVVEESDPRNFVDIRIHGRMMSHHFLNKYENGLKKV